MWPHSKILPWTSSKATPNISNEEAGRKVWFGEARSPLKSCAYVSSLRGHWKKILGHAKNEAEAFKWLEGSYVTPS